MAIAIGTLYPASTTHRKWGAMKAAITVPGAVCVSATGSVRGGGPPLEAAVGANNAQYWGYAIRPCNAEEQPTLGNGAVVEGFTGLTQGLRVFLADATGLLTHTAGSVFPDAIGIAISTTAILFFSDGGDISPT